MFYSHEILNRRGGKFSVIWLAATRSRDLKRRDYCRVNVSRTCDDIMECIVMKHKHSASSPRLSLYLSAQLMFGVVLVHNKHSSFLLRDSIEIKASVSRSFITHDIDLKTVRGVHDRITISDNLPMYTQFYISPDFGIVKFPIVAAGPPSGQETAGALLEIADKGPWEERRADHQVSVQHTVQSLKEITLPEPRLTGLPEDLYTEGLHDPGSFHGLTEKELEDFLNMSQPVDELLPESFQGFVAPPTGSPIEQDEVSASKRPRLDETPPRDEDHLISLPPIPEKSSSRKRAKKTSPITLPPVVIDDVMSPRHSKGLIVDQSTTLTSAQIRRQIETSNDTCLTLSLRKRKATWEISANDLLSSPGHHSHKNFCGPLKRLWQSNAYYVGVSTKQAGESWASIFDREMAGSSLSESTSPEDGFTPMLTDLAEETGADSTMEQIRRGMPEESILQPERSHQLGLDGTELSGVSSGSSGLFSPKPGKSSRLMEDVDIQQSIAEEDIPKELSIMTEIPKIIEESQMTLSPGSDGERSRKSLDLYAIDNIIESIRLTLEEYPGMELTFRQIVKPSDYTSSMAGLMFGVFIELASKSILTLRQNMAYGDIYISKGPHY